MKFRSAVDKWYYLTIVASVLSITGIVVPTYLSGDLSLISTIGISLAAGLPIWLLFSTSYNVENDQLIIRTGIFTWKIKLNEIESVTPSQSWLSSPALSLNRIEISYRGGKKILISPRKIDEFLQAIGQGKTAI